MSYDDYKMADSKISACSKNFTSEGGRISAYDHGGTMAPFQCELTITSSKADQRFYVRFEYFELEASSADCSNHKFEVYDGDSMSAAKLTGEDGLCQQAGADDPPLPEPIRSSGNSITFYLFDDNAPDPADFRIIYAAYKSSSDGECFECRNATDLCIDASLKCDGLGNCPLSSDESLSKGGGCEDTSLGFLTVWLIVFGVVIGVIVLVVIIGCICFLWVLCRRRTRPKAATATGYKSTADNAAYSPPPAQPGNLQSGPDDNSKVGYDAGQQEVVVPQKAN
ncbi:neuropilin and tolloid-like protein 2 isoform X2 [Ptychodera flava]